MAKASPYSNLYLGDKARECSVILTESGEVGYSTCQLLTEALQVLGIVSGLYEHSEEYSKGRPTDAGIMREGCYLSVLPSAILK